MTNGSRKGILALACAALVLAVAGLYVAQRARMPKLPPEAPYSALPPGFAAALKLERQKVVDGRYRADELRELARLYQANRLNREASACYAILGKAPGGLTAQDHYYLADIALDDGDLDRAAAELTEVEKREPQYLAARLELSEVYFKSGKAADAQKENEAILAMTPNQPQAMFSLARTDLIAHDDTKAINRLEALLSVHPEMTSAAALLAQVFDRRGEKERAALMTQWSRQKPEPVPEDPWSDALLADCYDVQRLSLKFEEYFASGEISQAVPLLNRVEELDPASPIPQLLRGWVQAREHNDFEAVRQYRMALDKGGDPDKICPYMVQSLFALGRVSDAAKLMAEFYAKRPDSVPILIAYSDVAVRQGDNAMAKTLLRKVLQREPYRVAANMNLARILWASGERDEAAACLERITKVSSSDVVSRALLGEYYLRKSDPASAIPPLEQAIALSQKQTPAYSSLVSMLYAAYLQKGTAGEEAGRGADALGLYEKAILLDPENPAAYARKATACAQLRQFDGAADALRKLSALQPQNPTIYLSLGDVLYQGGDADNARLNWQKALGLTAASNAPLRAALDARLNGPITDKTFE